MKETVRILIVDDISQVRQGLVTVLKLASRNLPLNIEVVGEAQDGNEAIERTRLLSPDVVLMDLEMPRLDGFAATRCIKSAFPEIGIIVLTIHYDQESRLNAAQAGADAFLEKGAPLGELLRVIQKYGSRSGG